MPGERIAIIGMGCRFPKASNPEAFWELLRGGADAITEVPRSRWDVDAFYHPVPRTSGKMCTRSGGFLEDVDGFDPRFFRIMPIEAGRIDPQHRLVLEVAWEALEDAGIDASSLAYSSTGVFIGVSQSDHERLLYRDPSRIDGYNGPNTRHCFAANRLSYFLNLRGPSMAVDTACSSALVAAHLACQSLRSGECDLALVGGVNLNLSPEEFIALSFLGVLSADGRCKTFDDRADGYGRGEGAESSSSSD
jgi:acyl transferase domain-containing protein